MTEFNTPEPQWQELDLGLIDDNFPMENYRDGQKQVISYIINQFNSGKRIVLLEAPTGSGKSAVAETIANMVRSSYYLTITKQLQDQLTTDFPDIVELKGRNAYECTFYKREGAKLVDRMLISQSELDDILAEPPNCSVGFCKTKLNRPSSGKAVHSCVRCFSVPGPYGTGKMAGELPHIDPPNVYSACPYYEQVFQAIAAKKVVMNFSSFLYQTMSKVRFHPRDLLIIDEAHNVESQILNFVSFSIGDFHLKHYGIFIPELESPYDYYMWFLDSKIGDMLDTAIMESRLDNKPQLEEELTRIEQRFDVFMARIKEAGPKSANDEWVVEYEEKSRKGDISRSVTIKPIYATQFTNGLLFKYGTRILLMSATILDVNIVAKALGLDRSEFAAYRMKNRFPVKNRPINVQPVAKMTGGKQNMMQWAPKLVEAVNSIVRKHSDEKGIIHTHNFLIMDHLISMCDSDVSSRFLNQRNFPDKAAMLKRHAEQKNSVIVAPAMHEGVDLAGDLSRFQIICKIPFANFFEDKQLAHKVEVDRRYYLWMTAIKLCQSYGRSIRSETDWAMTYILDESIFKFLKDAESILPPWFTEALNFNTD